MIQNIIPTYHQEYGLGMAGKNLLQPAEQARGVIARNATIAHTLPVQ